MVGIVINDDVIVAPIPIVAIGEIKWGNAEVVSAEPEAAGTASAEPPYEARTESALEVPVFPGMVEVIVDSGAVNVMPDPLAILVNVRSFGVAFLVAEGCRMILRMIAGRSRCVRHWPSNIVVGGRRSGARDVAATDSARGLIVTCTFAVVIVLSKSWERQDQRDSDQQANSLHLASDRDAPL